MSNSEENRENQLLAYSLLATLNNSDHDLFTSVYMSLFKYSFSSYAKNNKEGRAEDIKEQIKSFFNLDVPILVVRQMLRQFDRKLSTKEKNEMGFVCNEKGKSFKIENYFFNQIDDLINSERRNINLITLAFNDYLNSIFINKDQIPPFAEFIDLNAKRLSNFFSNSDHNLHNSQIDLSIFKQHADFLIFISENNDTLYKIAENLYLGSLIACIVETEVETSIKTMPSFTILLDTEIVLNALDLQSEEETIPTQELLKLIQSSNGRIVILDETLKEIEFNISNTIYPSNNSLLLRYVKNESIQYACMRKKISKTDLQYMLSNIRDQLKLNLGIQIINVSKTIITKAENTRDLHELENMRRMKKTALHDIIAYLFVREERKGFVQYAQKAKTWFMSANENLFFFNKRKTNGKGVPEIILPDELVCLLWLKNPNKNGSIVAEVGLKEFIAKIITSTFPEYKLLAELDENIKRYTKISEEQYALVIEALAYTSVNQIVKINNTASQSEQLFNKEIDSLLRQSLVAKEKSKQKIENIENEKQDLLAKLKKLEGEIIKTPDSILIESENTKLKKQLKIMKYISITIGCGLLTLILYIFLPQSLHWIRNILANIPSLGGLWGFINLIINFYKLFNEHRINKTARK